MKNTFIFLLSVIAAISVLNPVAQTRDIDATFFGSAAQRCLALNIYFEARGEPLLGQIAVSHVVLNRVDNARFPQQVCNVVRQGGAKRRHRCQFSWWCDGRSDRPRDAEAWNEAQFVAGLIRIGATTDPTSGALWYHAEYVKPDWSTRLNRQSKIGRHIFYTEKSRKSSRRERLPTDT